MSDIKDSLSRLDEWKAERERTKFMTRPRLRGYLNELARGYLPQHNIQWYVGHNDMGHRTGYVRVPKGHPWFMKQYDDLDVDVHGGLTFSDKGPPGLIPRFSYGWWVGFDCGHAGDAPDIELVPPSVRYAWEVTKDSTGGEVDVFEMLSSHGTVKSQDYVEYECLELCKQAIEALNPPPLGGTPMRRDNE